MKLGFVSFSTEGHLNPSCSLAATLRDRGHEIVFFSLVDGAASITDRGFEVRVYGDDLLPLDQLQESYRKLGQLSGWAAIQFTLAGMNLRTAAGLQDLPALFRSSNLDGLVIDQLAPDASAVARSQEIPFVNICNALPANPSADVPPMFSHSQPYDSMVSRMRNRMLNQVGAWLVRRMQSSINDFQDSHGLPRYYGQEVASDLAQITQIPKSFDFPNRSLPACFHYTGPFHRLSSRLENNQQADRPPIDFPWDRLDPRRKLVYVSMGTLQNRIGSIFRSVATACRDMPVQLVISVGGRGDTSLLGDLPGDPVLVQYAPQIELLQESDLCITHAGLNTTLECLASGVPMLAIPITNDQPGVAARIDYGNFGRRLFLNQISEKNIRNTVESLLADPQVRSNADRMKQTIAETNGLEQAATIVEEAFAKSLPS